MAKTGGPYSAYINKSGSSVHLYWSYLEGSSRAIYFSIQRCVNNGSWTTIVSNQIFNKYDYYDPIQSGWKTVQYGVKVHAQYSFDTDSDWTTTSTLTVNSTPTTPSGPYLPSSIQGGSSCSVSWGASTDSDGNLSGYKLERSLNGGGWSQVYSGAATSYSDYIGTGYNTVAYRVKAYDSFGAESGYATSSTQSVINNRAPTAPSSITVPPAIYSGYSFSISWGPATDADGNLSGYRLERSLNGGGWSQVYSGSGRSCSDTIGTGYTTVAYRVRAFDSQGATSGYSTSPTRTIIHNVAPTVPAEILVSGDVHSRKTISISWAASTDSNDNLSGYRLERSVNEKDWILIYNGKNLSYDDAVTREMNTLQYRVCAYDALGAASEYITTQLYPVTHNQVPIITGEDQDLGVRHEGFTYEYTVTDAENDAVTIDEYLDSFPLRSYPAQLGGTAAALVTGADWAALKQGSHTLSVNAIDPMSETAIRTMTFVKQVDRLSVSLEKPLQSEERPNRINVNVTAEVPLGATLTIETCNNGYDEEPVWEDATGASLAGRAHVFSNTLKLADDWGVNVRVTLLRGDAVGECYITGIGGNFD